MKYLLKLDTSEFSRSYKEWDDIDFVAKYFKSKIKSSLLADIYFVHEVDESTGILIRVISGRKFINGTYH